jgi:hypothetical protein
MTRRSPLAALCALALLVPCAVPAAAAPDGPRVVAQASLNNPVPTGEGDAIFVVGEGGGLEPLALRRHGTFVPPGSNEGGPPEKLRMESNAVLATSGNRVHVVFGGRTVATVPAKIENGAASIVVPPALHLGGYVTALASPTLGGHPGAARRAPTAAERAAALALAAKVVDAPASAKLTVRNLTAIDLGRGMALVGTIGLRGSGAKRHDKRLFLIAEPRDGVLRTTLANVLSIDVTEPLLEESGEVLVDAIDLGDGSLSVVSNQIGYDANAYVIYSRSGAGWKRVYSGGGAAL